MKEIWKYPVDPRNPVIETPKGAFLLCAHEQGDNVCIWAEVTPAETEKEKHVLEVYGTGHPFVDSLRRYLGTAFLHRGSLVFHVFEYVGAADAP